MTEKRSLPETSPKAKARDELIISWDKFARNNETQKVTATNVTRFFKASADAIQYNLISEQQHEDNVLSIITANYSEASSQEQAKTVEAIAAVYEQIGPQSVAVKPAPAAKKSRAEKLYEDLGFFMNNPEKITIEHVCALPNAIYQAYKYEDILETGAAEYMAYYATTDIEDSELGRRRNWAVEQYQKAMPDVKIKEAIAERQDYLLGRKLDTLSVKHEESLANSLYQNGQSHTQKSSKTFGYNFVAGIDAQTAQPEELFSTMMNLTDEYKSGSKAAEEVYPFIHTVEATLFSNQTTTKAKQLFLINQGPVIQKIKEEVYPDRIALQQRAKSRHDRKNNLRN